MVMIYITVMLVLLAGLLIIPLGLPGLWLMVVVVLGLVVGDYLSWSFGLTITGAALAAELAELVVLRSFGKAYGGSRKAFWGAILGGTVGLFVGLPVPLVGPLITAFLGTFLGAGLVTYYETRSLERSTRVGWGVLLARTVAVALKVATAVVILGAVGVALLL